MVADLGERDDDYAHVVQSLALFLSRQSVQNMALLGEAVRRVVDSAAEQEEPIPQIVNDLRSVLKDLGEPEAVVEHVAAGLVAYLTRTLGDEALEGAKPETLDELRRMRVVLGTQMQAAIDKAVAAERDWVSLEPTYLEVIRKGGTIIPVEHARLRVEVEFHRADSEVFQLDMSVDSLVRLSRSLTRFLENAPDGYIDQLTDQAALKDLAKTVSGLLERTEGRDHKSAGRP